MPSRTRHTRETDVVQVLGPSEATLLDLIERLLDKGVVANGELTLGVAGVDLIYLRLSALLCAADRVLPRQRRAVTHHVRRAGNQRARTRGRKSRTR